MGLYNLDRRFKPESVAMIGANPWEGGIFAEILRGREMGLPPLNRILPEWRFSFRHYISHGACIRDGTHLLWALNC
jgi:hypothetical protein